jgi:tetratricopeptide (TPR) repeat protein
MPAEGETRRDGAAAVAACCGLALLAVYVLPLYAPPGAVPSPRLGADSGLWQRLFPHVPGWWVGGRLVALALGAVLLAWSGGRGALFAPAAQRPPTEPASSTRPELMVLALAAGLLAAWTQLLDASHGLQALMTLALALPAVVLRVLDRREGRVPRPSDARVSGWGWATAALVAAWIVWRIGAARHDPRAADFVDVWKNFTFFVDAASGTSGVVAQQSEAGVSNVYLLLLGLPLLGPNGIAPSFVWIQTAHAIWIAVTAWGVACLARRFIGPAAMLPAVAALLFSPFMMSMAVSPAPFALATALGVGLLLLVCRIWERAERADVAALGALAGFSVTFPHLTLWSIACSLAVAPWLLRRRPSLAVWATATLVGLAAMMPLLSSLGALGEMQDLYLQRRGVIAELEPLIMGQKFFGMPEVNELWYTGYRGLLDVPLGALLQPFAILRSPVRLSGDVYYEPVASALAAVGIMACLAAVRRERRARALLAGLLLALLPGMLTSSFDRASLTRNLVAPVLLPVFTVLGLVIAARAVHARRQLATAVTAVIVASGVVIFDVVNPHIVAAGWLGIMLRSLGATPSEAVLVLEHGRPRREWLYAPEISRYLPRTPIATRAYQTAGSLLSRPDADAPAAPLLFWSPGLEREASITGTLCGCWPGAQMYTISDAAGLSQVYAARLDGVPWQPALPAGRWSRRDCPSEATRSPSCASLRAMAYAEQGRMAGQQGRAGDAVAAYEAALHLDPANVDAHRGLGFAFASQGRRADAITHYREAIRLAPSDPAVHNNLAIALEEAGELEEATDEYAETVRLAPGEPGPRLNLGAVLAGQGRLDEAIAQYAAILRDRPGMPEAQLALADALARQQKLADASVAYRDAANGFAAAGRYAEAAAVAERGAQAARAAGDLALARELDDRLARHRAGRP